MSLRSHQKRKPQSILATRSSSLRSNKPKEKKNKHNTIGGATRSSKSASAVAATTIAKPEVSERRACVHRARRTRCCVVTSPNACDSTASFSGDSVGRADRPTSGASGPDRGYSLASGPSAPCRRDDARRIYHRSGGRGPAGLPDVMLRSAPVCYARGRLVAGCSGMRRSRFHTLTLWTSDARLATEINRWMR